MMRNLGSRISDVVAFLSEPSAYHDDTRRVETIETHFAWVFLTGKYAYKVHKPLRFHEIDFTTLEKRKANCQRAIALNRRLSDDVYLEIVPIVLQGGRLTLDGDGDPIEWLVKMRRLPSEDLLDRRLQTATIRRADLVPVLRRLVCFYRDTAPVPWDGEHYLRHLKRAILQRTDQLSAFPAEIPTADADKLAAAQLGFIELNRAELHARIQAKRVVDAHGDLRPEHILPGPNPQVIDCLEFSDALRCLDSADEICGLAVECERFGRRDVGDWIIDLYRTESGDLCSDALLGFYQSYRALARAVLCAWHLEEPIYAATSAVWIDRTRWYLHAGMEHLHRIGFSVS